MFLKFVSSSHTILSQNESQLARMHFSVLVLSVSFSLLAKRMDLLKSDAKFTVRNQIIYKIVILPFFLNSLTAQYITNGNYVLEITLPLYFSHLSPHCSDWINLLVWQIKFFKNIFNLTFSSSSQTFSHKQGANLRLSLLSVRAKQIGKHGVRRVQVVFPSHLYSFAWYT